MNGSIEVRMVEALERIAGSLECLHEDMQDIKDAALGHENYYDDEFTDAPERFIKRADELNGQKQIWEDQIWEEAEANEHE